MNWGLPTAWLMMRPQDVQSAPMWMMTFGTLWCATHRYPSSCFMLSFFRMQLDYLLRHNLRVPSKSFLSLLKQVPRIQLPGQKG